jgi:hypothetical protein
MATPLSVSSKFKVGVQAAKGTAASDSFVDGRMKESMLAPAFEVLNPGAEHGISEITRPTIQRSYSRRTSHMATFAGSWFMYPSLIGVALRGLGFDVATVNNAGYYTHTFTVADRDDAAWLTVIGQVGDSGNEWQFMATDARVAQFGIVGNIRGAVCSMQGMGLTYGDSVGTETDTNEVPQMILATDGTLTATVGGTALVSTIRGLEFTITNPIYTDDHRLFYPNRIDLPQLGVAATGRLTGVDVDETLYNKLYRNGATSGSPSLLIPKMNLVWKFESPENITGQAVPYSLQVTIPNAEVEMTPIASSGRNLIRTALSFNMPDAESGTEPITIVLVNTFASYAGD